MTHIECPQCGHRALSVASRCPRCGHEFSQDLLRHRPPMPGGRPFRRGPLVAAGVVTIGVAALVATWGDRPGDPVTPAAAPPAGEETVATAAEPGSATPDSAAPPAASPPTAGPVPARRWATDWVNVRERRGSRAPIVRVLEPGDAVLVDSLRRGWYRVLANGHTLGYAHRRFLARTPPGIPSGTP